MKTLKDFNFKGKNVLLRADLNSDVKNGRVLMSERIKESARTIDYLKGKKAKVVVIAHQGTPGKDDFVSLKQHAQLLNRFTKIKFVNEVIGKKTENAIENLKNGESILLENIRFEEDEFMPEKEGNRLLNLVELCDIYVNDAFSVCHRKQTSIVLFPKYIKSCAGLLLEKEVNALKKIKIKDCLYVLGGAKPEDSIRLLKGNKVLACGLFGQCCLINKGKSLGEQDRYLREQKAFVEISKDKLKNVETPVDFAVKVNNKRKELKLDEFPNKYEIFDIGSKTIDKYVNEIKKAKAIYMKGPCGDANEKGFEKGTFSILKAIAKSKAYSVIGGGHLSDAIEASGINKKKFGHISLSGGALLNYVAGEKLPGLEALG
ncbi:MAG: phosphoglycerate kinase [Candidatus Nanoarchaeia archaeon]|nr:phosphoglycerate kinase [Candidatus Nanoarchaeia archaeon]MDD5741092.1 phosphoglycerate kinase [Candidatus Nanoarchaeia archaeon]